MLHCNTHNTSHGIISWPAQQPVQQPLLLRAEEVAELLQISCSKVYEMINAGELPAVRIGRSVRVHRETLRKWLEEQESLLGLRP
jgi:excisionase family DNA binding protein